MSWKDEVASRRISPELLGEAVPDCQVPDVWADELDDACNLAGIVDSAEQAMLLAQLAHESQGFNRLVENLNYSVTALIRVFGDYRISRDQAQQHGRAPGQRADQKAIANIVYGGSWGRINLGNTEEGDGWRFRGRGLIHTTGRDNYARTSRWIRTTFGRQLDLVGAPALLTNPEVAVMAAISYWMERVHPRVSLKAVTKAINGGYNGLDDRRERLRVARRAFGLPMEVRDGMA